MIKIIDRYKPHDFGLVGGAEKILLELKRVLSKIDKTEIIKQASKRKSAIIKPEFEYIYNINKKIGKQDLTIYASNNYYIFNKNGNVTVLYLQDNLPLKLNLNGILEPRIGLNKIGDVILKERYKKNKNRIDLIIAVSDFIKKQAEKEYNIKTVTIHNFVDTARFKPAKKRNDYIIFCGALVKEKGIYDLIDSMKILRKKNVKNPLYVLGTSKAWGRDEDSKIKDYAKGVEGIFFLGNKNQNQLIQYMQKALIGIVPSRFGEPFGLTALEFSSCGVPVVASNDGGLPEIIINNKTGVLFKKGDEIDLAKKISYLIKNKRLREQMGKEGRKRALTNFDKKIFDQKVLKEFKKLF